MFIASNNAFTIAETTVGPPMYLPAPSDTPKIIGELASCAAVKTACVHYKLLMLN